MKKQVSRILCIIIILCICISPLYVYAEDIYDYSYQEEQALYVDAESEEVADFNLIEDYYEEEANEQDCNEDLYQESEETIEELFLTPVEETLINNQEELSEDSEEVSTDSDANSSEPENTSNEIAEIETTVSYSLDETLPIESESDADIDDITIDVESKNEEDLKTNEFSEDIILSEDDEAVLFSNDADITQLILNIIENNNKIDGYYYIQYTDALTQYQFTITYRHDIEYLIFHSIQGDYTCQFDYDINNKCIVNDKVILSYLNSGYYPMVSIRANAYVDFTNYVYGDNLTFSFDESLSINSDLFGYEDLQENGNIAFKNAIKGWEIVLLTRAQSSLEKLGFEKFYYDNSDIDTISDNDDTSYIDDGKQYEQEPNNSRVSATILTLGQECNGEIGSYEKYTKDGDDVDFYAVNLKEGNKYRFSLTGYNDNFASTTLIIKIHKPDDNEISFSYQMERTGKDYYELTADVTGTYYIHLYNYSDYKTNKEHPYTIKVEEIISNSNDNIEDTGVINTDEQEPNNSRVSATVLTLGKECIGEIGSYEKYKKDGEDADFYAVNLKEGNKYRISFTGYNDNFASTTLIIKIHKPDDNEISFSSQMERTGKDYYEFTSDVTGTYYIHFYNYFDSKTKEEHPYTIMVEERANDIYLTKIEAVSATCNSNGNISYYKSSNGKLYLDVAGTQEITLEDTIIFATGHTEVKDSAIAATCTRTGLTEGSHCSVCGATIAAQELIPALGHNWSNWKVTKEATEETAGVETRTCSNDPSHVETRAIPVLAHTHNLVKTAAKAATCTASGNIDYWTCSGCGRIFSDASGNNEINIEDTIIKAKGHTAVTDKAKAATCTATGLTEGSHCSVCNYVIKEQSVIPALGHKWSDWKVTKEATEETAGVETRTCSNDPGHVETRDIPVKAHTHNLVKTAAKAATCTEAGNKDYWTCSGCGRIFSDASGNNEINIEDTVIPAKGHTSVTDAEVAATCTTTGKTEGRHCSVCSTVIKAQEVIPALGHHLVYVQAKEATTSAAGNKEHYKCDRCNKLFSDANGKTEIAADSVVIPKLDTTVGITSSVSTYNVASGIQVEWEPVDGASGYYIWRKAGSGSYSFLKTVSGGSNTSYTDTTATSNGKVYIYLVYTYAKADGKTVYSDDCNYSFTYRLSAPTISRVTNSASKKMTVKWNKNAKAAGYVIQYSLKSSFANSKYVVAYKASTVSKVISGLTKGKTYYVRMCSYRRYGGITHYSDWSNTQKVKISK